MAADLKSRILSWLVDEDYEVRSEKVPPEAPIAWALGVTVKAPIQVKLLVQAPREKQDRVAVTLGVLVSEAHRRALSERGPQETLRIMGRILESILSMCPDCIILVQPSPAAPEKIAVTKIIYEEDLTRGTLTSATRILVNAYLLIITVMNAELGTLPGPRRDQGPPSII